MDNGTLVQIILRQSKLPNRVSKVWLSDDLKMKAEDKLIQAPHKKMTFRYCRKRS
jgi:hypothetical protein